jgi:hypothetical protein
LLIHVQSTSKGVHPKATAAQNTKPFPAMLFWSTVRDDKGVEVIMFDHGSRLLWAGVVLLGTTSALFGDTAAGLQAFRKADYPTAYREWERAAEQGQAEAQYDLGVLYLKGLGVAKNAEEAFRWFRLAADQGQVDAQFEVGLMREKGSGVQKDYTQAQLWLGLAAERGDAEAEDALAEVYEEGLGVQKDLARLSHSAAIFRRWAGKFLLLSTLTGRKTVG